VRSHHWIDALLSPHVINWDVWFLRLTTPVAIVVSWPVLWPLVCMIVGSIVVLRVVMGMLSR